MDILKIVLTIIFVIDCIALSAIILLQEGKSAGLGTISGVADTYWGQNKGRSMEGTLEKFTKAVGGVVMSPKQMEPQDERQERRRGSEAVAYTQRGKRQRLG